MRTISSSMIPHSTGARLVPALRYRNVGAAIDWLCGAFGFEKHDVVTAVDGTILHARLAFGNDLILILPVRSADPSAVRPAEEAGNEMQSCYFVVDDADAHYRHAKASGAEILDITEYDYGGRGYSCRDPEGHIWNFGTYNPRYPQSAPEHWPKQPSYWLTVASDLRLRTVAGFRSLTDKINPPVVVAAVVAAVIAAATVGWLLVALPQTSPGGADKRLTFRSTASQRGDEVAAQQPAGRPSASSLSVRPVPQPVDDAQRGGNAPSFAAVGAQQQVDLAQERVAKEAAAEEALRQLRAAQRNAGEAMRQLRATPDGIAIETVPAPAPVPPKQIARATPDQQQLVREQQLARDQQLAREQQLVRERAAKESAAQLEEQFARERAAKEAERARLSALAPAPAPGAVGAVKEAARPPQEQKPDSFWDCQPNPAGQIICNPVGKKPGAAETKVPVPLKPKAPVAEAAAAPVPAPATTAAAAPAPPAPQRPDTRIWDCQPKPPTGEVVCRPMGPGAAAKQ